MIEVKDLPQQIINAVNEYNKGESFDVFPSKFYIDGDKYYFFTFSPSTETLIVNENGSVPHFADVKKVGLYAYAYNTSIENLVNDGFNLANDSTMNTYENILKILKKVKGLIQDNAPLTVKDDFEVFMRVPETVISGQQKLCKAVESANELLKWTNDKEITTEADRQKMRDYILEIVRSSYNKNEIQLKTSAERDNVMEYLASKKWSNPKLFYYYLKLKSYHDGMLTWDHPEVKQRTELKESLEKNTPLEKDQEALKVIENLRNPRS